MLSEQAQAQDDGLAGVEYCDAPPLLLVAQSAAAAERAGRSAAAAGCRILGGAAVADDALEARLAQLAGSAAIFMEVEAETASLAPALDVLQAEARSGRIAVIVSAPSALIDLVAARTPAAIHLCEASEAERVAALALATRAPQPRLRDVGREDGASELQRLSREMERIAGALARLSEEEAAFARMPVPLTADGGEGEEKAPLDPAFVRGIIRARRLRDHFFRGELFADPAWDMLLDLFAARLEGNKVAVSSLCIAAAVPPTTALRWIKALTDRGLLLRVADPDDGRRVYIELSKDCAAALDAYFRAARRVSHLPV